MSFSLFRFALFVVMLPVSNVDVFVAVFLSSRCLLLRFLLCDLCHVFNVASRTNTVSLCLSKRPEVLFRVSLVYFHCMFLFSLMLMSFIDLIC